MKATFLLDTEFGYTTQENVTCEVFAITDRDNAMYAVMLPRGWCPEVASFVDEDSGYCAISADFLDFEGDTMLPELPVMNESLAHELSLHAHHSGASIHNIVAAYQQGGINMVVDHGSFVSMSPMLTK